MYADEHIESTKQDIWEYLGKHWWTRIKKDHRKRERGNGKGNNTRGHRRHDKKP